ncbi:MAG TPA: acyl-CoA dehydrogenase family protein [Ilumatobacteraceae bacterium]|nr:acyl-CoA dehydrogenase family protein [Ilumatobacteraceae bacterium]
MPLGENLSETSILAERAKSLVPLLDTDAEFADTRGELSPAVVEALHREGLLKMWVPEKLGGSELDPLHSLEVLENLSYGDASAGWVTMAANLSIGTAGAYLSDAAVAELWADGKSPVIAGQGTRPGTAKTVDGGHLLSGSWSFGSGLLHSTYVHSLGIIEETGEPRIFVTPIEAVKLLGNWDVMGLCGTGSIDYSMDSVFVPDGWSHFAVTTVPERGGNLYGIGIIGFAVTCHSGWAMGVGRRMLDELAGLVRGKAGRPGAQADNSAFQQGYAEAEARFRAARAFVVESWTDLSNSLYAGEGVSVRQHTLVRLALTHITRALHDVANFVYLAGGTTALRRGTLQRLYRDVHAGTQHVTSSPNVWQTCARELLGVAEGKHWQFLDLVD